jgi:antitoxin component YwqK of YwqJK toxin-antitoxin module
MIKWTALILCVLFMVGCDTKKKDIKSTKKSNTTDGVKKYYRKNGKLKTELTILNGKRNGVAKNFYENEKISLEMNYVEGKRQGTSKNFFLQLLFL